MAKFEVHITLCEPYNRSFVINPQVPNIHYAEAEARKICRKAAGVSTLWLQPLAYNRYDVMVSKRLIGTLFIKELD